MQTVDVDVNFAIPLLFKQRKPFNEMKWGVFGEKLQRLHAKANFSLLHYNFVLQLFQLFLSYIYQRLSQSSIWLQLDHHLNLCWKTGAYSFASNGIQRCNSTKMVRSLLPEAIHEYWHLIITMLNLVWIWHVSQIIGYVGSGWMDDRWFLYKLAFHAT